MKSFKSAPAPFFLALVALFVFVVTSANAQSPLNGPYRKGAAHGGGAYYRDEGESSPHFTRSNMPSTNNNRPASNHAFETPPQQSHSSPHDNYNYPHTHQQHKRTSNVTPGQEQVDERSENPSESGEQQASSTTLAPPSGCTREDLHRIEMDLETWKADFAQDTKNKFMALTNQVTNKHRDIENKLTERAERYIRSVKAQRKASECEIGVEAVDALVEKIGRELTLIEGRIETSFSVVKPKDQKKKGQNQSQVQGQGQGQGQQSRSHILGELDKLGIRLAALSNELFTEQTNECTERINRKIQTMTQTIAKRQRDLQNDWKWEVLSRSVRAIDLGKLDKVKAEIDELLGANVSVSLNSEDSSSSLTLADLLTEIVSQSLISFDPLDHHRFGNILTLLKQFNPAQRRTGLEILVRFMQGDEQKMNTVEFLWLAYEVQSAGEFALKKNFTLPVQQLIWGTTQCLLNKRTNQFLFAGSSSSRTPATTMRTPTTTTILPAVGDAALAQAENPENESDRANVTVNIPEAPEVNSNKLEVYTAKSGGGSKDDYCSWEFHPVSSDSDFFFLICKSVEGSSCWNLNVERSPPITIGRGQSLSQGQNMTVQVSPASVNPHFKWEVVPRSEAQYFSLRSLNPLLGGADVSQNSPDFLCGAKPPRGRAVKLSALIQEFNEDFCQWSVHNPFEKI